jgi:DNA (cytosine-5)-methyltransferase 1
MKHLDLFAGIGGFSLACQWAGIETIGFVEIDKYCQKVLKKHWPGVPIVEDIRDVEKIKAILDDSTGRTMRNDSENIRATTRDVNTSSSPSALRGAERIKEVVANAPSGRFQECELCRQQANDTGEARQVVENPRCEHDEGQLLKREYETAVCEGATITSKRPDCTPRNCVSDSEQDESPAILVTAGFPCQPFSVAGKRQGERDDRYLWPQTIAVIKEIKPEWVLLENVTGIINLALDTVLSDLEGAGYSYETLVIPACAVNAWHRRDRVWIVAYSECERNGGKPRNCVGAKGTVQDRASRLEKSWPYQVGNGSQDAADTPKRGLEKYRDKRGSKGLHRERQPDSSCECNSSGDWWATEPELGRVAHGISNRVDRLKCLGNAIVPQVAFQLIKTIVEVENGKLY